MELSGSDIRFVSKDTLFTYKVIGIIIEDGHLLVVTNDAIDFYHFVGGAIQFAESSKDAVLREVFEETAINYEVDRLIFVYERVFELEELPTGNLAHEVSLCYLMKPKGEMIQIFSGSYGLFGDKEMLRWLPIDKLEDYKIYPKFLADRLKNIPSYVEHIVQIDTN